MNKIVVIGASGHAKVIIDIIEKQNIYKIQGFIDTYKEKGTMVYEYEVLGTENELPELIKNKNIKGGVIAIGDNYERMSMAHKIKNLLKDFYFITAVHPESILGKNVHIGAGSVIMAGTVVNNDVKIGNHCILNTISSLDHDGVMKDFSSLAPGSIVGGNVKIGKNSVISLGAVIRENVTIGDYTVVGAGSVVTKNIGDYKVVYGVPAKEIKERKADDKYLSRTKEEYLLEVWPLKTQKELNTYSNLIDEFQQNNPFYKVELLDIKNNHLSETYYFTFKKSNILKAVMPFHLNKINTDNKRFDGYYDVSSPYGYSGPILKETMSTFEIEEFWYKIDIWYKKNNVISEFIRFSLNDNFIKYSGICVPSLQNVKGKIIGEKAQWNNYKPKVRNNYRKAEKENLRFSLYYKNTISKEIIEFFYEIYITTMQRNSATEHYFLPIKYFIELIQNNSANVAIAMVYKGVVSISTELILVSENMLYSYLGGTMAAYFHTRPNDYLKINVINWARENDFKYYILGGGRMDNDNLYKYKKAFFPKDPDVIYYTGRKIIDAFIYRELVKFKNLNIHNDEILSELTSYFPVYRNP